MYVHTDFGSTLLTGIAKRIGPLAQAAPNIGPMMWEEIKGPDGIVRQMQWTSRVESSNDVTAPVDNGRLSYYYGSNNY